LQLLTRTSLNVMRMTDPSSVDKKRKNSFHKVQKFIGCTPSAKRLSYASYMQTESLSAIKERWAG